MYERAGEVIDKRTAHITTINPDYLGAVAELTPYTLRFLKRIYDGDLIEQIEGESMEPLGKAIAKKQDLLGETKFNRECRRLELTEEEVVEAKRGRILSGKVAIALASLLKLPPDEVYLMAIAQLNQNLLDEESKTD